MSAEDLNCEKQINDANALGNALLSGLIGESVIHNKKNIKIASSLGCLSEAIKSYKLEIEKLRLLQIGACSDVIDIKEVTDYENLKSITESLQKIVDVLKSHVNHNAANAVSKKELLALSEQVKVIESVKDELAKQSSSSELKKHSKMVSEISNSLQRVSTSIKTVKNLTDQMQNQAVLDSAATLYFSGYGSDNGELKMPF